MKPFTVTVADACFCHWPVAADAVQRTIPEWLTVETAADDAWLTAIPHTVTEIAAFGVTLARPAPALTVRTYVRGPNDQRGLYFFALVPGGPLAGAAEPMLGLPVKRGQHGSPPTDDHDARRTLDIDGQRVFDVRYTAETAEATPAPPDSLPAFLVERERFFTSGPLGGRLVGNVGHDPWPLSPVEATVSSTLSTAFSVPDPVGEPLVHHSPGLELSVAPPGPLWLDR